MISEQQMLRSRAKQLVHRFHAGIDKAEDDQMDVGIGLRRHEGESGLSLPRLLVNYGQHRMEMGDISYAVIRDLYKALSSSPSEKILDLGSGYGRIALYGALLSDQSAVGIEIVEERVREATRIRDALALTTIRFAQGDILKTPWPDASIYLVLNPVFPWLLPDVIERIRTVSRSHRILIASLSSANKPLSSQTWLKEIIPECHSALPPVGLRLFESISPPLTHRRLF